MNIERMFLSTFFIIITISSQNFNNRILATLNQQNAQNKSQFVNQTLSCPINCLSCDQITQYCFQCQVGYSLLTTGQCAKCSNGCSVCSGTQMCQKCSSGFVKIAYQIYTKCLACSPGCERCSANVNTSTGAVIQGTTCSSCYPTYYINKQITSVNVCLPCLPGCYFCSNSTICFQCFSGFGYNDTSRQCYVCQQNCLNCAPQAGCLSCSLGYYPYQNQSSLSSCQTCMQNCKRCLSNITCTLCIQGFYVYQEPNQYSMCIPCPNQCKLCQSQIICLSCIPGYYLYVIQQTQLNITTNISTTTVVSATCEACPQNCVSCNQNYQCQTCQSGYFITPSGNCQICGAACHSCTTQNQCLSCQGSYYLQNGQCQACNQLCSSCALIILNNQPVSFCYNCISVYYITSPSGKCIPCSESIYKCLTCQQQNQCLSCYDGYYLHQGNCLQNNKGLGAAYIVMLSIAGIIAVIAIGFAIWACWRHQNGYGVVGGNSSNSGIRASYYQIP